MVISTMGRVRSKANALSRLLDTITRPIYVVDRHRTLVYCNAACGDLIGIDASQLIGLQCDYRAPAGNEIGQLVSCFSPPPAAFNGERLDQDLTFVHQAGQTIQLRGQFIPLGADRVTCAGVLVVLLPVDATNSKLNSITPNIELDASALHEQLVRFRRDILLGKDPLDELVGQSRALRRIRAQVRLGASGATNVVVLGVPGTGRERIARAIHYETAPHAAGPLAPVLCPVMDPELLQVAIRTFVRETTNFPSAAPQTMLLLEVDQLPRDAQIELIGFLDLPGFHLHTVATARQSLLELADQNAFQPDLAHALSTLVIDVPPLRQRREDIPLLAQYFVEKYNSLGGPQRAGFSPAALDELTGYDWPENVDELAAIVAESCRRARGALIEPDDLADQLQWAADADARPQHAPEPILLDELLLDVEREVIERALRLTKGNKTKAARLLGINRARLHRRLEHFGLA